MNNSYWETELLNESDYYKKVLLDGCIVKKGDVEMCDLRFFFTRRNEKNLQPRIQVYKHNKNGREELEVYHNFDEAFYVFASYFAKK